MSQTFTARRLLTPQGTIDHPVITVEDGLIHSIETATSSSDDTTLTATFLDIHMHGAASHDVMEATPEAMNAVSRFLATRGVGRYLPTTVTAPVERTLRSLEGIAAAIESPVPGGATPIGIHLEGPFISHVKRGVHPPANILPPSVELFDRFQEAARGHIRLMTIAPEAPGAMELIEHAARQGVKLSVGHSNATRMETLSAIAAGATSATHTYNAMRPLDHREPGIVGTILDREDLYAEAICDGVHVHPAIVRLWLKVKGEERAILVTDGMSATGVPDGTYTLGDFEVVVKDGVCLSGETLAGSVLTMDQAVANVRRFTGTSLATAVRLASRNPARMMGMSHLTQMATGTPANFNVYDEAGDRTGSIFHGRLVE